MCVANLGHWAEKFDWTLALALLLLNAYSAFFILSRDIVAFGRSFDSIVVYTLFPLQINDVIKLRGFCGAKGIRVQAHVACHSITSRAGFSDGGYSG